ncbi:MAG: GNAT family N-acetyltransferase [Prolixibacteraceae bacterium]|nr:GNAT family N-acetyltransferase [Prolixibacteraceae bacterium]
MPTDYRKIKIRRLTKNDIPILVNYRLVYLKELQAKIDPPTEALRTELEKYFTKAIAENRFIAFIAESEGKALGFGGMVIKEIPGDFVKSSYLEGDILNMFTVPEARRKGVSSLILDRLIKEAKKMGISKVALHTSKDGEKLYRNFGFSEPRFPYLELVISDKNFTCNHE